MSINRTSSAIAIVAALIGAGVSQAETRTFEFAGNVTSVPPALDSQFSVDQPMIGRYSFDTETTDRFPADLQVGDYISAVDSFSLTIGDYQLTNIGAGDIQYLDNKDGKDSYIVVSFASGEAVDGRSPSLIALQLSDSTATVNSSDLLQPIPPSVEQFDGRQITVDFTGLVRLVGSIETLQVPEPSSQQSIWLALVSLVLLTRSRR